jgi:hypothetical protein
MVRQMPRMKSQFESLGRNIKPEAADSSFSMCIASGPYTPDADLHYKPWHRFLDIIKSQKPTVVLLVRIACHLCVSLCPVIDIFSAWTFHRLSPP